MSSYLYTSFFFADKSQMSTTTFSDEDIHALFQDGPGKQAPCLRASSRKKYSADCIAKLVSAAGTDPARLAFLWSVRPWSGGGSARILPFEDLIPIAQNIDGLLEWGAKSVPVVNQLLEFMDTPEDIQEALRSPVISANPNRSRNADSDGFGAWFLFSYLASIASVAREAHASQRSLIFIQSYN
jgi:hypothetical protein